MPDEELSKEGLEEKQDSERFAKIIDLVQGSYLSKEDDLRLRLEAAFGQEGYRQICSLIDGRKGEEALAKLAKNAFLSDSSQEFQKVKITRGQEIVWRIKQALNKKELTGIAVSGALSAGAAVLTGVGATLSPVFLFGAFGRIAGKIAVEARRSFKGEERELIESIINHHLASYRFAAQLRGEMEEVSESHGLIAEYSQQELEGQIGIEQFVEKIVNYAHSQSDPQAVYDKEDQIVKIAGDESDEPVSQKIEKYQELKGAWDKIADKGAIIGSVAGALGGGAYIWHQIATESGAVINPDLWKELMASKQEFAEKYFVEKGGHLVKTVGGGLKVVIENYGEVALRPMLSQTADAALGVVQRVLFEGASLAIPAIWRRFNRQKEQAINLETRQKAGEGLREKWQKAAEGVEIKETPSGFKAGEIVNFPYTFTDKNGNEHTEVVRAEVLELSKQKAAIKILDDDSNSNSQFSSEEVHQNVITIEELNTAAKGAYTAQERKEFGLDDEAEANRKLATRYKEIKADDIIVANEDGREFVVQKVDRDRNEITLLEAEQDDTVLARIFKLTYTLKECKLKEELEAEDIWSKDRIEKLVKERGMPMPVGLAELKDFDGSDIGKLNKFIEFETGSDGVQRIKTSRLPHFAMVDKNGGRFDIYLISADPDNDRARVVGRFEAGTAGKKKSKNKKTSTYQIRDIKLHKIVSDFNLVLFDFE